MSWLGDKSMACITGIPLRTCVALLLPLLLKMSLLLP